MMKKLTQGQKQLLEKTYLSPSQAASFSSAQKLRAALISKKRPSKRGSSIRVPSLKQIQAWLLEKRPYTLHRPARKHYKMKKVIVSGVNHQLQMDLIDMQQWAAQNDSNRYILIAIDCFSRYAYSRPLRTKQGVHVVREVESILDEAEARIDKKIKQTQTDGGTEFFNKDVKALLEKRHVNLFETKSPTKAQMAERLIRTLRSRQERFNTFQGKRRWLESFPKFVSSYNKTVHSSLPKNMAPADVNLKNERKVWEHLYGEELLKKPKKKRKSLKNEKARPVKAAAPHFSVGDHVRLSKRKRTFEKAYYQNFTDEIFTIAHVSRNTTPPTYKVVDGDGQMLEGIFYREELTAVRFDESTDKKRGKVYAVESVLKEEVRKDGKKYIYVKWRGYPDSQNEWIRADQFTSIKKAS
jgi:hypothetical protein